MKKLILITAIILLSLALLIGGCSKQETSSTTTSTTSQTTSTPTSTSTAPVTTTAKTTTSTTATTSVTTTKPTTNTGSGQSGGIFRVIVAEFPSGSVGIPWKMSGANPVNDLILQRLMWHERNGAYTCILAESFEWADDFTTLVLHLRKGIKFHDGTDFNAQAVKWNYEHALAAKAGSWQLIKSVEATDNYTFKIHTQKYSAALLPMVTAETINSPYSYMISPTAFEKNGEDWANYHPVGTGAFKLKEYIADSHILTERFDDYWEGKPYLDGVEMVLVPDPVTAQLAFEAGAAESVSLVGKSYLLMRDLLPKGFKADSFPDLKTHLLPSAGDPDKLGVPNTGPLGNAKVRMAIEYAINKKAICDSVFAGYYNPVYSFATPEYKSFEDNVVRRSYDPAKAKALLAEAGYPDGFKITLYSGTHLGGDDIPLIQSYLNAVNIKTTVEMTTVAKWIDQETNGWNGLLISPTGNDPSFGNLLSRFWTTPSAPNWSSGIYWTAMYRPPEMQAIIDRYMAEKDTTKAKAIGTEFLQAEYDNCISIPLWDWISAQFMQPYVHDARYEQQQLHRWDWGHAWMEQDKIPK
jgi:peptide/nickel transport system substrate-binding protein